VKREKLSLEELRLAEVEAKKAWKDAIRAANEAVGLAYRKWISANEALTEATIQARAKK
jgi:hypothetical protein